MAKHEDQLTTVDAQRIGIRLPVWSVISGSFALISFGIGMGWLGYNVRDAISGNQLTNNLNHKVQMAAIEQQTVLLKQIVCLNKWQLYNERNLAHYRGECD